MNEFDRFVKFLKIASEADGVGQFDVADDIEDALVSMAAKKDKRPTTSFVFGPTHSKVKDHKGHYPINDEAHARNALSRVNQTKKAPPWWSGSVQELVSAVARAVKSKFPKIEVSKKSKIPGKG